MRDALAAAALVAAMISLAAAYAAAAYCRRMMSYRYRSIADKITEAHGRGSNAHQ